jgi:glutamyl-Q tRNA(Asp) synthetase
LDAARRALGEHDYGRGFLAAAEPEDDVDFWLVPLEPERLGDVVLARKEIGVAYHLAVVVDDAAQGITQVIRGEDLLEATHIQVLLQRLLGFPTPIYRHHRLLLRPDGKRYAKRDTAETLREIRASGVSAAELRRQLGFS